MILTHPVLFNSIVVLFIAFTSGWVVFVISSKESMKLKKRIEALENEKKEARRQICALEEQLEKPFTYPLNSATVINFSSSVKTRNS